VFGLICGKGKVLADRKITELANITGANLADADEFVVVDASADETKAITFAELKSGLDTATGFVRITGDTMTGDLNFGDNNKAIFGAGSDLQIYHSGSNSHITESGTGNLIIRADDFRVQSNAGEEYIAADANGAVSLRYDNAAKLATTSTGVDITGTLTSDGLTVDGSSQNVVLSHATDNVIRSNDNASRVRIFGGSSASVGNGAALTLHGVDSTNGNYADLASGSGGYVQFRTGTTKRADIASNGDISFYEDTGTTAKLVWKAADERLGIGTSSPTSTLDVRGTIRIDGGGNSYIYSDASGTNFETSGARFTRFYTNSSERMRIDSSGNVGIGTTSPASTASAGPTLEISGTAGGNLVLSDSNATTGQKAKYFLSQGGTLYIGHSADDGTSPVNDLVIDSSGNLLVGTTNASPATNNVDGAVLRNEGHINVSRSGGVVGYFNRGTSDGTILDLRKDGAPVGSIGFVTTGAYIQGETDHSGLRFGGNQIIPFRNGADTDDTTDLGAAGVRFDDIYATNGTIQTSDQNEKQQIASLTDAEITAAKAISKLFKTFKWNDSVAEKGDAARTHTGVIAQEVEQAMTDAGLNAGDYAFFISSDWTDEETGEERNRKGIRYPQLMSFIGAATEQRLASIEARLDALEGV